MMKLWEMIKSALGLDSVGTIVKARLKMLGGLISAGMTAVASYSFLPFLTDSVNWMAMAAVSAYLFIDGMVDEFIRRYNATDV